MLASVLLLEPFYYVHEPLYCTKPRDFIGFLLIDHLNYNLWQDLILNVVRVGVVVFNATFNNISVISWRSVHWWRKPEYPEKTTNLSQVAGRENHIMLYQEVRKHMSEIRTHNLCGDQNVVR
jgi:hypothetical protein